MLYHQYTVWWHLFYSDVYFFTISRSTITGFHVPNTNIITIIITTTTATNSINSDKNNNYDNYY
jgi:hypothetical protein